MKIDRLLSIVVLLLNNKRMTAEALARRFEVTVRTIYRDIDAINSAGIPVISCPGPGGGFCIDQSYAIDRSVLGLEDLRAVVSALKGINAALDDRSIQSALERIESLGPRKGAQEVLEERIAIDLFPWGPRDRERRLVKILERTIAERRLIEFGYPGQSGLVECRRVEPMTLVFKAPSWYLWGYCRSRDDYRLFKLSRIQGPKELPERFMRRARAYTSAIEAPSEVDIILRIDAAKATRAEDWFGEEELEKGNGGSLRVRLRVPTGDWILNALLSFGPGIEILKPLRLREALAVMAEKIATANHARDDRRAGSKKIDRRKNPDILSSQA